MKRNSFIFIATIAALASFAGCQREAEVSIPRGHSIALELAENPFTKVDVAADNGICTWTANDAVGLWVTNSSTSSSSYRTETVNSASNSITPDPALTMAESVTGYAIYPDIMRGNGATPTVNFLDSYSMSGRDLSSQTYSYVPMMAEGNDEVLRFYHVGALMRLILSNVPAATNKVRITFTGMTGVTGTSTVSNPGSAKATTGVPTGGGNVVTFTDVSAIAAPGKTYLNIPLPTIDFSHLTQINVEALNGDTVLAAYAKNITSPWGTLKHGWGRIYPVDFGNAPIEITSSPATIWKSQTTTYTATTTGTGLTWHSDDEDVATVDENTGEITAVGEGEANITALTNGGASVSAPVKVYVNEVSAISEITADKTTIGPGVTASLSVTITHTENGTITSYPAVTWTSGITSYVTVSPASSTPVFASANTATASATATGVVDGVSSITASVAAVVTASGYALLSEPKSITCEEVTTITGGNGSFRGYYIAPGFLQYDGTYSLTPAVDPADGGLGHAELDGLASVMAAYGTAAGRTKHYFTLSSLASAFGGITTQNDNSRVITGTAYSDGIYNWRIPTKAEWNTIISDSPLVDTKVGNTPLSMGLVKIVVNLSGSNLDGEGLTTDEIASAGTNIVDGGTVNRTDYIAGLLLIPDGATITCPRIKEGVGNPSKNWSVSSNCITYEDFEILVTGGCVFLPAIGFYYNYQGKWNSGGTDVRYWSSRYSNGNGDFPRISNSFFGWGAETTDYNNLPVRVICTAE